MGHISNPFDSPADALAHYGVLGMKWGVRNEESKDRAKREGGTDDKSKASSKSSSKSPSKPSSRSTTKASTKKEAPKKLSRRERRAQERANKDKFYQEKARKMIEVAKKDPESLITLDFGGGRMVVTGKQFVTHMSRGGMMNVKTSDIFATKDSTGTKLVKDQGRIGTYQKDK